MKPLFSAAIGGIVLGIFFLVGPVGKILIGVAFLLQWQANRRSSREPAVRR